MIEVSVRPETVESRPTLIVFPETEEEQPVQAWQGWFSPQDDRDGGHSER